MNTKKNLYSNNQSIKHYQNSKNQNENYWFSQNLLHLILVKSKNKIPAQPSHFV